VKDLKNGPATLYSLTVLNNDTTPDTVYMKLYDTDGDGLTFGTTSPDIVIPCAGSGALSICSIPGGLSFASGLTLGTSTAGGVVVTGSVDLSEWHLVTS
jgi:hypothetical protein